MNQFKETFNLFKASLTVESYSNYDEWVLIPDNLKAVALYVVFYEQITLAWMKTRKPFMEEETAISTLMQYLLKNVPIIESDEKRFTPAYLYKVAFNAFYPLGKIKRDISEFEHRASPYMTVNVQMLDLDYEPDNPQYRESAFIDLRVDTTEISTLIEREEFWKLIESTDMDTKEVIECLINRSRIYGSLAKKKASVIQGLRTLLKEFYSFE